MAYVSPAQMPRGSRLALANARWERLGGNVPDLIPAIRLQEQLVKVALDLLDAVEHGHVPRLSLPPKYIAAKLGRGVPALTAEPIPMPAEVLGPGLVRLCGILEAGGAGPAAAHIGTALAEGRIEAGSLLSASLARDQAAIRQGAEHLGLAPDLLWLIAELAAGPYAHALQQRVLSRPDASLAAALDQWSAGYCPACGSWPALAEIADAGPVMRCSFCAMSWAPPSGRCVYCRTEGPEFHSAKSSQGAGRQLDLCDSCGGYLKVAHTGTLSPFPLLAITDLETAELDVEAMALGYHRPALAAAAGGAG
ncbi:MAG: formate dehydrogenase accessory protein FdhE [Vicinamibacterales bacterium]